MKIKCRFGRHKWEEKNPGPRGFIHRLWIRERQCTKCLDLKYGYATKTDKIDWTKERHIDY